MHRRALDSLTPQERAELADLIRDHVTNAVLDEHRGWHQMHGPGGMSGPGSGERFFAFHRNFIGKLEDSLRSQGKNQFVPLPTWNPIEPIPPEFSHPERSTNSPGIALPSWATIAGGTQGSPIFGYTALDQFQSSDELGRALGANFHGAVHNTIGGDMGTFASPRDPIFYPWHAFLDDIWSRWEGLPSPGGGTGGASRCFIATAAYGSELEPPVIFLREFRDDVVLQSRFQKPFGKILNIYYSFSPPIAEQMRKHRLLKYAMKYSLVWPFVVLAKAAALVIRPFVKQK